MIYADSSFLVSLYALDGNTPRALKIYNADARRPLTMTPWQRFEVRNALRLAGHKFKRAKQPVPFNLGSALKQIEDDLRSGVLRHKEPDWRETFKTSEELSRLFTESTGAGGVDVWHVAAATVLEADTFWTFDKEQALLADKCGAFDSVES